VALGSIEAKEGGKHRAADAGRDANDLSSRATPTKVVFNPWKNRFLNYTHYFFNGEGCIVGHDGFYCLCGV